MMIKWIEMKRLVYSVIAFLAVLVIIIFPSQTANAHASVKLDYSKTIITLNETVVFKAEASEISNITWYCDDVAVKSEWATSSNYTFIPKAIGTYLIKLSVDGFTNPPPSGPTKVTVITDPASIIEDQHFTVNQKLWAFDGYHYVCSFTAIANEYLEFNIISTNSDPDRPDDVFIAVFKIESSSHGISYVSGTTINQKVNLNYTDTYTISVAKHPFYATITVSGTIDLKPNDSTVNPTSPTASPRPNPSSIDNPAESNANSALPTINVGPTTPNQSLQLLSYIVTSVIVTLIAVVVLTVILHKRKNAKVAN